MVVGYVRRPSRSSGSYGLVGFARVAVAPVHDDAPGGWCRCMPTWMSRQRAPYQVRACPSGRSAMSSQNAGATPTASGGINQPATSQCVPVRGPDRTRRAGSTRPIPRLAA